MASKNKLLSKGGIVEQAQEQPKVETPIDLLPDVSYPTWMKHETLDSIIVNSKQEYYDAVSLGYVETDRCYVKN
jgi:hypothetical protein